MATCYRHPNRETGVSCSNCGNPICPDCMTPTPVGMRCPDCSRAEDADALAAVDGRRTDRHLRPDRDQRLDLHRRPVEQRQRPTSELVPVRAGRRRGRVLAAHHPGFLHTEIWHILLNGLALFWLGRMIEPALGHARFVGDLLRVAAVRVAGRDDPLAGHADPRRLGRGLRAARRGDRDGPQPQHRPDPVGPGPDPRSSTSVLTLVLSGPLARRPRRRPDRRPGRDVLVEELARAGGNSLVPAIVACAVSSASRRSSASIDRRLLSVTARRPAAPGTRSGCSAWASHSRPSTSRGPGRENQAEASATTIRSAPSARELVRVGERLLVAALDVVAARRDDDDLAAARRATSSQERCSDGSPGRPSRSSPPAYSISCGTQWPPTKTGSSHSSITTRTRGASRTASRTRSMRAAASWTRSTPASLASVAWASVRTSPSTSPSVCGSSETIVGTGSMRAAIARTSSTETAQTLHSAWVTIRSGAQAAQAGLVELVDRAALLGQLAHRAVDLVGRQAGADHVAGDLG